MISITLILQIIAKSRKDYIVMFKTVHDDNVNGIYSSYINSHVNMLGSEGTVKKKFFNGYVGNMSSKAVEKINNDPHVMIVEEDRVIKAQSIHTEEVNVPVSFFNYQDKQISPGIMIQQDSPWGLSKLSQGYHINNTILGSNIKSGHNILLDNTKLLDDNLLDNHNILFDDNIKSNNILFNNKLDNNINDSYNILLNNNIFNTKSNDGRLNDENEYFRTSSSSSYYYPSSGGEGTVVFVVDTGIDVNHPEFGGRAKWGANLIEGSPDTDENGHGTHCAGIIGGKKVGVAKKVGLVAIKVLDAKGEGLLSRMVLGLDYVIRTHTKYIEDKEQRKRENYINQETLNIPIIFNAPDPIILLKGSLGMLDKMRLYLKDDPEIPKVVVNMSVGGIKSRAIDFAVEYASNLGINFAVAAGNDATDACEYSPASSKAVLTAGASTNFDSVAFFSNTGVCVDLFAPGTKVLSSWAGGKYRIAEGTSMASPHVAGVLALYLDQYDLSFTRLRNKIVDHSRYIINEDYESTGLFKIGNKKYPLISTKVLLEEVEKKYDKSSN